MTDTIIVTPPAVTQVTVSALATANVLVTSPIINTGTSAAPIIGINQTLLSLSKAQVGLTNVDNTSDLNKPISTATQTALDLKLDLTTASSTYATPAFVGTAISNLVNSAPATLDTLNELATALNNDPAFATTIATSIGGKVSLTGSYSNPSWITGLAWSKISTTPTTLSGYGITDAEPTITAGTTAQYLRGDKSLATFPTAVSFFTNDSAYITSSSLPVASSTNPIVDGTATIGSLATYARADHVHPTDTSRAASSHTHGNITNTGLLTTAVTLGSAPKFVITDTSTNAIGTYTPTGTASATTYLSGTGVWSTPAGGGGGGSGFTGAGTLITGIEATNLTSASTVTASNISILGGNATSSSNTSGVNATGGNLTITSGTASLTGSSDGSATAGNLTLDTGAANTSFGTPVYGTITIGSSALLTTLSAGNGGTVNLGMSGTATVNIGNSDSYPGAGTVNIMARTGGDAKTLKLATDGGATSIKVGTSASSANVQIGVNSTAGLVYNFGKLFTWQPTPVTTTTARLLTAADLLTFIVINSTAITGNLQLPTPANMDTNFQSAFTDVAFEWSVINTAASGSVTVTANGNHTVIGNMVVLFNTSARFRTRRSAATPAYVTYRIS